MADEMKKLNEEELESVSGGAGSNESKSADRDECYAKSHNPRMSGYVGTTKLQGAPNCTKCSCGNTYYCFEIVDSALQEEFGAKYYCFNHEGGKILK